MTNENYSAYDPSSQDIFHEMPVTYGGFWERFAAALIDGIILAIPNFVLNYMTDEAWGNLISVFVSWLYYALQESSSAGATIGKKALGLRVTSLDGQQISFGQATGRYFGKIISAIIIFIGYLMMLWDERKQTLHDKMAGTLVIKDSN